MGRRWKKQALCLAGWLRTLSVRLEHRLWQSALPAEQAFADASEVLAGIPGRLGIYARQSFYRGTLAHLGQDVHIGYQTLLSKPAASLGDRVYIGRGCTLGLVHIEDDAMLADGVQVLSGRHQHGRERVDERILRDNPQAYQWVRIGRGAWIGAGAIVMADVGDHAIVAAGAVVVQPVAGGAKVGGVPARPLRAGEDAPAAAA